MTVLLWGSTADAVVTAVGDALGAIGVETLVTDSADEMPIVLDGDTLLAGDRRIDLDGVTGVLVRPSQADNIELHAALAAWTETTTAVVLNRLSASASNRSKPYQLGRLRDIGFALPDTIVTTDPSFVWEFIGRHPHVIYKSTSGVRSIVKMFAAEDQERIDSISACPTQFQQYIDGTDIRVHVIGRDLFAVRIDSAAVDYRYGHPIDEPLRMEPTILPAATAAMCLAAVDELGLQLAGIDLRIDPRGRCWCFEINTAPGFIWFEQHAGQPIAASIARRLAGRH